MKALHDIHRKLDSTVRRARPELVGSDPPGDLVSVFVFKIKKTCRYEYYFGRSFHTSL